MPQAAELGLRFRVVKRTAINLKFANDRGSTPLHYAAGLGHLAQVHWLLAHGAHESLHAHNALGATPLDLAHTLGPHPEVEAPAN